MASRSTAWALVGFMSAFCATYVWRMFSDPKVAPSAATWLIFTIATAMVVASYRKAGNGNITRGALIFVDAGSTWIIFGAIVLHSGMNLKFQPFDIWYLGGSLAIALFWLTTRNHRIANLLVQGLIAVGYLPTYHKIVADKVNTEPFYPWLLTFGASLCGVLLAKQPGDGSIASRTDRVLSTIYAWRSLLCSGLVLLVAALYS